MNRLRKIAPCAILFTPAVFGCAAASADRGISLVAPEVAAALSSRLNATAGTDPTMERTNGTGLGVWRKGRLYYMIWTSTVGRAGSGLLGVFDQDQRPIALRATGPILSVKPVNLRGIGTVLCLEEYTGAGTGLDAVGLRLVDPANPQYDLWFGDVGIQEEGLAGRNEGRTVVRTLCLADVDSDGLDEILLAEVADKQDLIPSRAKRSVSVYHYNRVNKAYESHAMPLVCCPLSGDPQTVTGIAGK